MKLYYIKKEQTADCKSESEYPRLFHSLLLILFFLSLSSLLSLPTLCSYAHRLIASIINPAITLAITEDKIGQRHPAKHHSLSSYKPSQSLYGQTHTSQTHADIKAARRLQIQPQGIRYHPIPATTPKLVCIPNHNPPAAQNNAHTSNCTAQLTQLTNLQELTTIYPGETHPTKCLARSPD